MGMVLRLSPETGKWLILNISIMAVAMLTLWRGARSGNGKITLCALARTMPLDVNEKHREKRLYRLLRNKHLEGPEMTPFLVLMALGHNPSPWVPIVVDQTTINGVETIMAGVLVARRVLPVAFCCFTYEEIFKSQNSLEYGLVKMVAASLPHGCKPLFVMDRGYGRVAMFQELKKLGIPYLIRTRRKVTVTIGEKKKLVGRLYRKNGMPRRYENILYHGEQKEPVDLVVYHDPEFKEPWYLVVPPNSEELLSTGDVVALYRDRMHIELTFRDWKTHLGLRGLRLEADKAMRLSRLLLALTAAYILAVLMGAVAAAKIVRQRCEVLRRTPRHGTRRRLSALSVGILMLSLKQFERLARKVLFALLEELGRAKGALYIAMNAGDSRHA
ncbi:MAG: transposase [Myxococcota bacterium]|jgi:hypothetical protein